MKLQSVTSKKPQVILDDASHLHFLEKTGIHGPSWATSVKETLMDWFGLSTNDNDGYCVS